MGQKVFKGDMNLERGKMLASCEAGGNYEGKGIPGRIAIMLKKNGGRATCDVWRSMNNFVGREDF